MLERAVERGEIGPCDTRTAASFCVWPVGILLGILLDRTVDGEEQGRRIKTFAWHAGYSKIVFLPWAGFFK